MNWISIGSDNGLSPSHYLNQLYFIVNWTLENTPQWNYNQNTKFFIHMVSIWKTVRYFLKWFLAWASSYITLHVCLSVCPLDFWGQYRLELSLKPNEIYEKIPCEINISRSSVKLKGPTCPKLTDLWELRETAAIRSLDLFVGYEWFRIDFADQITALTAILLPNIRSAISVVTWPMIGS